jgi:hypothetical protein
MMQFVIEPPQSVVWAYICTQIHAIEFHSSFFFPRGIAPADLKSRAPRKQKSKETPRFPRVGDKWYRAGKSSRAACGGCLSSEAASALHRNLSRSIRQPMHRRRDIGSDRQQQHLWSYQLSKGCQHLLHATPTLRRAATAALLPARHTMHIELASAPLLTPHEIEHTMYTQSRSHTLCNERWTRWRSA